MDSKTNTEKTIFKKLSSSLTYNEKNKNLPIYIIKLQRFIKCKFNIKVYIKL